MQKLMTAQATTYPGLAIGTISSKRDHERPSSLIPVWLHRNLSFKHHSLFDLSLPGDYLAITLFPKPSFRNWPPPTTGFRVVHG
jgi:hypothetical protein